MHRRRSGPWVSENGPAQLSRTCAPAKLEVLQAADADVETERVRDLSKLLLAAAGKNRRSGRRA